MKKQNITSKALCILGVMAAGMVSSRAAVTIFFSQVGTDVIVSAEGTIDVDPSLVTSSTGFFVNQTRYDNLAIFRREPGSAFQPVTDPGHGTYTSLGLTPSQEYSTGDPLGPGAGSFGFGINRIFFDSVDITGGTPTAVSQITWDRTTHFFTLQNRTLADMGADGFNGNIVWTAATTGDTIGFESIPDPNPIPEPSSLLLGGLGCVALILRRRRR